MADLLRLMGENPDDLAVAATVPVTLRRLHGGDSLFHQAARAESIYFVRDGTFKHYRIAEDGDEQVLGFAGRAEVLGFGAIDAGRHPTAAVALEESSVYVVTVQDLFTLGHRIPGFDRVVYLAISAQLAHRNRLADLREPVPADARLARFLLRMIQRLSACGPSPRRLHLRMSRRDIASYLGLAHETVSRSFGILVAAGCLRVHNREVEILDLEGLTAFARSAQRQVASLDQPLAPCANPVPPAQTSVYRLFAHPAGSTIRTGKPGEIKRLEEPSP
ncbi:MAG: helix-turn-helix domain-containing protein [Burkholderiaceae bacterium]|nr:helix-turn-helix domain-containing protein [Burkholderiaceae bacterium]